MAYVDLKKLLHITQHANIVDLGYRGSFLPHNALGIQHRQTMTSSTHFDHCTPWRPLHILSDVIVKHVYIDSVQYASITDIIQLSTTRIPTSLPFQKQVRQNQRNISDFLATE